MAAGGSDEEPWWRTFFEGPFGELQLAGLRDDVAGADVDVVLRHLGVAPGAHLLDVPCGAGRHALELARRGYRVTGIDLQARLIEAARDRAFHDGLEGVELAVGDMRSAAFGRALDGAYNWWGSFGYFDDQANEAFLARVAEALRPGARVVLSTHVTETLYPRLRPRDWAWVVLGGERVRILEERALDVGTGVLRSEWTFVREGEARTSVSEMRIYAFRELRAILRRAGFAQVEAFDDATDHPLAVGSRRATVVATRADPG
ncbi:MAG: SAM-dependent methyltransferase [Sandaracinaceae bacterium]